MTDHIGDALGVLSGIKTKFNTRNIYKQSYWLARGDPKENNFVIEIVNFTKSKLVAKFFELCLEKYTISTMAGEHIQTQEARVFNPINDNNIRMFAKSTFVQYFVACSLTKSILINWKIFQNNMRSIVSFSPSKTAPCLHQSNLMSRINSNEQETGVAKLMQNKCYFYSLTTSSSENIKNIKISNEIFEMDNLHITHTGAFTELIKICLNDKNQHKFFLFLLELKVSFYFSCYYIKSKKKIKYI